MPTSPIVYLDERLGEIMAVVIECVPGKTLTEEEVIDYCREILRYKRPWKVFFG